METFIIVLMISLSVGLLVFGLVMAIDLNKLIEAEARADLEQRRAIQKSVFK